MIFYQTFFWYYFLLVNGDKTKCSLDLKPNVLMFHRDMSHCKDHTEIWKQVYKFGLSVFSS